ncbi:MAG TPA: hypothetical protein VGQ57_21025, partial [Polyangiaceae bacterium]|nr:hypothetical protein [Polyangiaceae bacterium]
MYVHARTLIRLAQQGILSRPLSLRRSLYACGFGAATALIAGGVTLARRLDELLYPGFRRPRLPSPLFVLATPRSGTTYLHRLLALDEERFLSVKLYQTIAPSIALERAIGWLGGLEGPLGRALRAAVAAVDRRMFP